jgi:hypothetical protein
LLYFVQPLRFWVFSLLLQVTKKSVSLCVFVHTSQSTGMAHRSEQTWTNTDMCMSIPRRNLALYVYHI